MILPQEIKAKAERKWWALLRAETEGNTLFPLRIPGSTSVNEASWSELNRWLKKIIAGSKEQKGYGYRLVYRQVNTRTHGPQHLPKEIWIDTREDLLRLIGRQKEYRQFVEDVALLRAQLPDLSHEWFTKNVKFILRHAGEWRELLEVVAYFQHNVRPGLYLRNIPVSVDSKFIESHRQILQLLLDELLPEEAYDAAEKDFVRRYGLRSGPFMIRFRLLDPDLQTRLNLPALDLALPLADLNRLPLEGLQVIVSENLMPYLSLPNRKNTIVIWGEGGSVSGIRLDWLGKCEIWYWGDIDVQGLRFLGQFRSQYPHTRAWMMDRATLEAHPEYVVEGTVERHGEPTGLTLTEMALYQYLKAHNQRLEQERIGYSWRQTALAELDG